MEGFGGSMNAVVKKRSWLVGRVAGNSSHARLAIGLVLAITCGCNETKRVDDRKVAAAVRAHVEAMAGGDVGAALATVDPDGPAAEDMAASVARLAEFEARLDLTDLRFSEPGIDSTEVGFTLVVEGGAGFRGRELRGTHDMRWKSDGWKVYSTEIRSVEYRPTE